QLGFRIQCVLKQPFARVFLMHGMSAAEAPALERLLQLLSARFHPTCRDDLLQLIATGQWCHSRPGAVLTFDDGLRSDYEIAAPLLERYGFQGWFFVPVGLLQLPPNRQPAAAREQLVDHAPTPEGDPRVFMTLEQLRDLAKRHVIGCHTLNHVRLS